MTSIVEKLFDKENGNVVVPLALFLMFFIIRAITEIPNFYSTILALFFCFLIFKVKTHKNEYKVFILGLVVGSFIEIVLGFVNRTQFWKEATFLGIPTWLPIAWAMGFVVITRVGMTLEGFKWKKEN